MRINFSGCSIIVSDINMFVAQVQRRSSEPIPITDLFTVSETGLYEIAIAQLSLTPQGAGTGTLFTTIYLPDEVGIQKKAPAPSISLDQPTRAAGSIIASAIAGGVFQYTTGIANPTGVVDYILKIAVRRLI